MVGGAVRAIGRLLLAGALLGASATRAEAPAQPLDDAYGKLIAQHLTDPRITTELVDHMPASDTVPSPLKFFGRIPARPAS